jgi:site-specific DNA-methyltransferase (adenine-specific)
MKPYYQDKWVTIYHGDCREILPQLDVKVDLVLTDPPYGVGKDYGEGSKDDLPTFVGAVSFITSLNTKAVIFCPVSRLFDLPVRPEWIGIWRKNWTGLALRSYPFYPHWEALAFYHLKGDYAGNKGHRSDVFDAASIRPDPNEHPAPKPESLISELIMFLQPELILDPFLGSGTTCYCAKKLNRHSIGIEIEEKFCEIAARRCSQEVMDFSNAQDH